LKATGIVRRVDDLGRVVIPKEIRNLNGMKSGTPLEFLVSRDEIILRIYQPGCVFCREIDGTRIFKGKSVCNACRADILRIHYKPGEQQKLFE